MKKIFSRALSALLSLSILVALTCPALASQAMGDDLTAADTLLNRQTQLSTNVFWSTAYSDYRTENLVTYTPNEAVRPIVTYGGALTDRNTVSKTAAALESEGYRVVAGINGDFYNVGNGLPIGVVITKGRLRSSDGGYHAVGFRADGTAVFGKPGLSASVQGYLLNSETGERAEFVRKIAAVNKARTNAGIYLYTYDFNGSHTTGNTQPGVDVICALPENAFLSVGETIELTVEQVLEAEKATAVESGHAVLSANLDAGDWSVGALRGLAPGDVISLSISAADPAWNDVDYAVGALYSLVENGAVVSGLQPGSNPRTAIGQRADGSVIFYTIDGRKSGHSIGATMTQIAERLIELGCVTAYCLDGGGSTTLTVTKPTDTAAKTINTPSDGGERAVSNQIFLVASNRPTGELSHFHVSADHPYVLAGSRVNISAAAIDTNYIPMQQDCALYASAGTMEGSVLTTPLEGGEITVTAESAGSQGSTVIHAITAPDDVAIRDASNAIIQSLSVAPGVTVQLHGSAAYHHFSLKADPEAFSWSLEGDIGSIDENGLFTAGTPGTGRITVSAGVRQASIEVTVAERHLETLEDFEGQTTIFRGMGKGMNFSLVKNTDSARLGRAAGRIEYDLSEGDARWNATAAPRTVSAAYTGLNLWVYGDGSGNHFSLLYGPEGEEPQTLPVTTLDFTGWKQISVSGFATPMTIRGMTLSGTGSGTIYLDHITATFDGIVDNAAPVITAELDQENWTVSGAVSDAVDGILPAENISMTVNGSPLGEYDPATGRFTISLPGPGESGDALRITVTAKDASGNIGRTSVDTPAYGAPTDHAFTDTAEHWAADYADFLYSAGVTTGYADGTFRPNQNVSRAQFAVMLYRYLGLDEVKYAEVSLPFADLGAIPGYALPAVRALYAEGVVNGSGGKDGKLYFNPGGSLTRAQAAAMIGRTQAKGFALAENTFTDAASIPAYARDYIRSMTSQGVISGYGDGSFRPHSPITRGQMAKILYTLM